MFSVVSVEAMAWKNVDTASMLAIGRCRPEKVRVTSSNDVSMEGVSGKSLLKSVDLVNRLSVRRFEAQAIYAFTRSASR
jgi:hypothetical protein